MQKTEIREVLTDLTENRINSYPYISDKNQVQNIEC